jgi:hypothetical protein
MLREFVIIDSAIVAAGEAFIYCKLRVNVGAISPQRNLCRIAEPVRVLSIQVLCQTSSVSLINMVLVAEVGRDLRSVGCKSISTLFANQHLLLQVNVEVETCKKRVRGRFHIESIHQQYSRWMAKWFSTT